jgi:hypothetical protein
VQVAHIDAHAMLDASAKRTRQLIDPSLPHEGPSTAGGSTQEILAASTGSVDAVLDAQEDVCPELRDLGRDRPPQRMTSSFKALMPDGPNAARFSRRKEHHLGLADRVARCATARRVLRREQ